MMLRYLKQQQHALNNKYEKRLDKQNVFTDNKNKTKNSSTSL